MGRTIIYRLFLSGLVLIAVGIAIMLPVEPVGAQSSDTQRDAADYAGSGECESCHKGLARDHGDTPHALALQDVSRKKKGILADFDQGEDVRTVQFPGEDAPRPFTADDIAFAIGAGRYVQRYVYEVEKKVFAVFPAEWNTVTQAWQPYALGEGDWLSPAYDFVAQCAGCHTTGLDLEKVRWQDDGVQCEACHGPGDNHIKIAKKAGRRPDNEELTNIHNAIVLSPDSQICGQCHSQGMTPDSAHPYPTTYLPGGTLLDDTVFQLLPEDDQQAYYASGHGRLNNMQFNEWLNSAHAGSLDTLKSSSKVQDGCVVCHSGDHSFTERILAVYEKGDLTGTPPDATTLASAQFGITCVTCHSPHEAADVESNLVSDAYTMCTSCHRNTDLMQPVHHPVAEMFEGQPIIDGVEGIPSVHFAAEDGPRCVTCHMSEIPVGGTPPGGIPSDTILASHTWKPVIPGEEDTPPDACSSCHKDLLATDLQSLIKDTQASVRSRLSVARARLGSIPTPEHGSDTSDSYNRVVTALNFIQNDGSMGVHNYAYVDALLNESSVLLAELSVPGASMQPTEGPAPTATPAVPQPITVGMELPARTGLRPMTFILIGLVGLILLGGTAFILRQTRRSARNQGAAS